jgi:hypothetical protein
MLVPMLGPVDAGRGGMGGGAPHVGERAFGDSGVGASG